jgi:predicted PurR-regulated permease PerM
MDLRESLRTGMDPPGTVAGQTAPAAPTPTGPDPAGPTPTELTGTGPVQPVDRPDHDVPRWLARGSAWGWRLLVLAAAIALLLYLVSHLLVAIIPVVGALFITAILLPLARWLRARGLVPLLATWIAFLLALGVLAGLAWWLIPTVGAELGDLRGTLSHGLGQVRDWLTNGPFHLSRTQVDSLVKQLQSQASQGTSLILHGALAGVQLVAEVLAAVLLTFVLTFFFVKDGESLAGWLGQFADPARRDRLRGAGSVAWQTFTAYVQGTAINGLINGTLMGIGLFAIGVPLALPIAVITFFGGFFPLVGGIVSGVIAILVALVSKGIAGALLVTGLAILIHNLEGYVVGPFVLGQKVRLHAVVILLALSVGTIVGGIFGAFVAVPVTAITLALVEYYRGLPVEVVTSTAEARSLPQARLAVVKWVSGRRRRHEAVGVVPATEEEVTQPGPQPEGADSDRDGQDG